MIAVELVWECVYVGHQKVIFFFLPVKKYPTVKK